MAQLPWETRKENEGNRLFFFELRDGDAGHNFEPQFSDPVSISLSYNERE